MSAIKRRIQKERLGTPIPTASEVLPKGKRPASAKDQFLQMREAAQLAEQDGE